jgi:hypothetical protein
MGGKMVRKQVYFTEEEERSLRQLSFLEDRSQADIIREAVDHYLEHGQAGTGNAQGKVDKESGWSAGKPPAKKSLPLDRIVGLAGSLDAPDDLSSDHDRYLYGGEGG